MPLYHLGQLAIDRDDFARARELLAESLVEAREWGRAGWGVAPVLMTQATLATAEGQPARAILLAGAAVGLREERQAHLQPTQTARLEAWIGSARSAVGQETADREWAAGHAMTLDEAIAYAFELLSSTDAAPAPAVRLTPREMQVAQLLARFATNRDIAAKLVISERTVKRHVENILLKLGVRSRVQVAERTQKRRIGVAAPSET